MVHHDRLVYERYFDGAEGDERFARITIGDLLTMSSGIRYVEKGLPWSDDALTGTSISDYMATRLWQPLGAESDATWSLDSEGSPATSHGSG